MRAGLGVSQGGGGSDLMRRHLGVFVSFLYTESFGEQTAAGCKYVLVDFPRRPLFDFGGSVGSADESSVDVKSSSAEIKMLLFMTKKCNRWMTTAKLVIT